MGLKKYWIETFGCQMNKAESSALEISLKKAGWEPALKEIEADLIILNTCSVRMTAEERLWGRIGRYKHLKKKYNFRLVIVGCMAERLKESIFKKAPVVDMVIGNFQKHNIADICNILYNSNNTKQYIGEGHYQFFDNYQQDGIKALIPVMHGCNNFCTYCIVPYVRGPEVSRPPENILNEIKELEKKNIKEITLIGQNVNAYFYKDKFNKFNFNDLLKMILSKINKIEWVRFISSHPKYFSIKLIDLIKEHDAMCSHIHLPVQHGSDKILKMMGRKYNVHDYLKLIYEIKKRISDVAITTDILIGFPGETEEDFKCMIKLLEEIRFDDAFLYKYNVREGTIASRLKDEVAEEVKRKRLSEVIELQRRISHEKKKNKIGKNVKVLIEDFSKKKKGELLGRTEQDEMVVFPGKSENIGEFTQVKIMSLKGNTFWGKESK